MSDDSFLEVYESNPSALAQLKGQDKWTTKYTAVSDDTELVMHTYESGYVVKYEQTWPCPLTEAPKLGELYQVLHDEWISSDEEGEFFHRFIRKYRIRPENA